MITWVALYVNFCSGALVRVTNSGLGCPDWPLCNGRPRRRCGPRGDRVLEPAPRGRRDRDHAAARLSRLADIPRGASHWPSRRHVRAGPARRHHDPRRPASDRRRRATSCSRSSSSPWRPCCSSTRRFPATRDVDLRCGCGLRRALPRAGLRADRVGRDRHHQRHASRRRRRAAALTPAQRRVLARPHRGHVRRGTRPLPVRPVPPRDDVPARSAPGVGGGGPTGIQVLIGEVPVAQPAAVVPRLGPRDDGHAAVGHPRRAGQDAAAGGGGQYFQGPQPVTRSGVIRRT